MCVCVYTDIYKCPLKKIKVASYNICAFFFSFFFLFGQREGEKKIQEINAPGKKKKKNAAAENAAFHNMPQPVEMQTNAPPNADADADADKRKTCKECIFGNHIQKERKKYVSRYHITKRKERNMYVGII